MPILSIRPTTFIADSWQPERRARQPPSFSLGAPLASDGYVTGAVGAEDENAGLLCKCVQDLQRLFPGPWWTFI